MNDISFLWIFKYFVICVGSYFIIKMTCEISKDMIYKKHGSYVYELYTQKIPYTRAFLISFFTAIAFPMGVTFFLAIFIDGNFLNVMILGAIILVPVTLLAVESVLNEMKREAAKNDDK